MDKKSMLNSYILLDRSGSMQNRWAETIGALNSYVSSLKEKNINARITVAVFDSGVQLDFSLVRQEIEVSEFLPLALDEVKPRGGTPLFDALASMERLVTGDRASLIIITDGEENSSKEVTQEGARKIIDRLTAKGYDISYIGADFNAFSQSHAVGLNSGFTLNMSSGNYDAALSGMVDKHVSYSMTGVVRGFTQDERSAAMGDISSTKGSN